MPTGTRARETAERKRRLVDAAIALAGEGGYDAVQMRDVAARAEVAIGTLYRHFASKDQLLLAAMAQQATALREDLGRRPPRGDTPAVRVAEVFRRASRALERAPDVTRAMLTAMTAEDPGAVPIKHEIHATLQRMISDAIGTAAPPVPHVDEIAGLLGSVWFAELTFWTNGLTAGTDMGDNLARAAALLLGD